MRQKMTKSVLNDMFEDTKIFLKRASSSGQIESSMFFSLQFYIQVIEAVHYVSQKSNSFPLSFPKKSENALAFLHILLTSCKKNKKTKVSAKLLLYSSIFHNCAHGNLYNCTVFRKKRFHCYFLALNPLFPPG